MENEEKFRAIPENEDENSQHESKTEALKAELIEYLKEHGFDDKNTRNKISEWEDSKNLWKKQAEEALELLNLEKKEAIDCDCPYLERIEELIDKLEKEDNP